MKIAVWKTNHEIADTVAEAVYEGLKGQCDVRQYNTISDNNDANIRGCSLNLAYGILRGTGAVFKRSMEHNIPWICIDKGYWKPGHYDGYYRISLNGTQQTIGLDKLEPDYERWEALGLEITTCPTHDPDGRILLCPPTDAVSAFFGLRDAVIEPHPKLIIRRKDSNAELQKDFDKCSMVRTFNSSVGWEALRQGIPCISDETHSFVGAYKKQVDNLSRMDIDSRKRMFAVQASLQLTLEEIKQGLLWPLITKLLNVSSVTIPEKL